MKLFMRRLGQFFAILGLGIYGLVKTIIVSVFAIVAIILIVIFYFLVRTFSYPFEIRNERKRTGRLPQFLGTG